MATTDREPILASWKISEVLKRHPELLEELIGLSPAFEKLRNPMLRRVQSRLVTVSQAAGIAGLEPAQVTRALNRAAGITPPADADTTETHAGAPAEAPGWVATAPVATELDVRPLMARGEEPFRAIMAAAREVPAGSVLLLTVGFEPLPLYDALAKQGFAHWAVQREPDRWEVRFHRDRPAGTVSTQDRTGTGSAPAKATEVDWSAPAAEVTIDVSELVPPEPMVKILQTLETLPDGSRLLVHHVRRPIHLYDRLDEMGYAHATRDLGPGRVEVMIQKREGAAAS
jgi:uncharacterized protein (DUF2249 family)